MEMRSRRLRTVHQIQDQENIHPKGKVNVVLPAKKEGLTVRGALGELKTNVQVQRDIINGKGAITTTEIVKKATNNHNILRSNYSHVQSKIDTGLASKAVVHPVPRPPLRREESTATLAAKAAARTRAILRDAQNKPNEIKDAITCNQGSKKITKLPAAKETLKVAKNKLKPILKEPTESLGKLKLNDAVSKNQPETKAQTKDNSEIVSSPKLPDNIEDVDRGDNNPLLMSIYVKDIYKYLTDLEEKYPIKEDHLSIQVDITGNMRATLIDWIVDVSSQFSFLLETFQLTVGIIDRYLQAVPNIQRSQLQCIGVTAMFIASKYEEIYAPEVDDFIYVTNNTYTKSDVFQCERDIMLKLGFCLARPIPLSFLRRFIKVANGTAKQHHLAKYFIDLSLVQYNMAHYRPSELAASALCLSMHLLSSEPLSKVWTPTLSYYSGYSFEHIEQIISKLAHVVVNVENCKFKAVYNKYSESRLAKVSCLPQLKSVEIHELASSRSY